MSTINPDPDDALTEFLLTHNPADKVLAFVTARDDVRRIQDYTTYPTALFYVGGTRPTLPVPGCYVAEPDPFRKEAA